ncbi:putative NAD(P)H nitroreductase acg [Mycolicibacterium aichiense]|uniref:NAD(P)H nitroreductase acg n=2 Tax=Mycolicibacterium aichiense TaxID=1799 RepID=A0AAD1MBD4_9MYCO|nr:NAD(P)H nitroreductase [Mycolicibacterium aichiense]MCV7018566.1 NAD(P)H nitroreductase [Mycolicibacterium aichiense]BBX07323.1 putative NAD(P)H nitroreductase acg [Mycolicibacterium aichiense]STZ81137.1 Putative NAD(P)H nitroreductase Acg [Mycolicibacterium aichiense]
MVMSTLDPQVIANAVELACRAPSVHNSQPWRWVAEGPSLKLFLDAGRVPHATDRSGREAVISCGAVLDHVRVAVAAAGWEAIISRFPNPNEPEHLATIDFSAMEFVTDAVRSRADAILVRRTDRLPLAPPPDWTSFESVLRSTVDTDRVAIRVLPDSVRPQLAQASRLTESLRRYDASYHAELAWWTAPYEVSDGVPHSSLVSVAERDRVDVARVFPGTEHADRRPEVDQDRSTIVVLSTFGDSRRDALECGEVLSDVLLEATLAGLATCTLTHMTELAASRDVVRALTGNQDDPQLLIRVGLAPAIGQTPPATPRRPLSGVLEFRG